MDDLGSKSTCNDMTSTREDGVGTGLACDIFPEVIIAIWKCSGSMYSESSIELGFSERVTRAWSVYWCSASYSMI